MKSISFLATSVTLHRNLSWAKYFASYSREIDGRAHIATYSFDDNAVQDFVRLMPFSTLYIDERYKAKATTFARRFPMFLVFWVERLHSKCIFFEKSGRALVGSQNLFAEKSEYEEVSTELIVPPTDQEAALELAFNFQNPQRVNATYDEFDVLTYQIGDVGDCKSVVGQAYLPCHREDDYWIRFGQTDSSQGSNKHYVYVVLEYRSNEVPIYLAFDRHYQFCGELTSKAFSKLAYLFQLRPSDSPFLDRGLDLRVGAPFKDLVAKYHPIARNYKPVMAHYVQSSLNPYA